MVDILAAVALKCRWIDCNRQLERGKDDSINLQQKDEAVQVVTCNASKTLREVFAKFNRLQFLPCGLSITSAGSRRAYHRDIQALAYAGTRLSKAVDPKSSCKIKMP